MPRLAALLLFAACASTCTRPTAPPPMPDAAPSAGTASATPPALGVVGRYRFDLPPGFAFSLGDVSYEYLTLTARPWPGADLDGDAREDAFAAAVAARLAFVQSNEPPSALEGIIETAFIETREIGVPGARAAWAALSYDGPYGTEEARRWDVLLDAGPVLIEGEYVSDDAPDVSLARVVERLGAVRVPGDAGFGESDWLYGGGFALAVPEGNPESTTVGYTGPLGNISGGTAPQGAEATPLRFRITLAERELRSNPRVDYGVVRNEPRVVAGRLGDEAITELHAGEGDERVYQWEATGVGSEVSLSYGVQRVPSSPPLPPRETMTALWDALLNSVRPAAGSTTQ